MADEATRVQIRELRAEFKEGLVDIKAGLGALLPREVYSAERDALRHRVEVLEREAERAEAERVAARRWVIACVVLPLVTMAVTIILNVTGP